MVQYFPLMRSLNPPPGPEAVRGVNLWVFTVSFANANYLMFELTSLSADGTVSIFAAHSPLGERMQLDLIGNE